MKVLLILDIIVLVSSTGNLIYTFVIGDTAALLGWLVATIGYLRLILLRMA